ncbi:hypothetical protein B4168_2306 [Anoxybacillus flavithermus]|nr:hypothetical protein B4168_2306 [Anoxybacillus flavithermus]
MPVFIFSPHGALANGRTGWLEQPVQSCMSTCAVGKWIGRIQ